MVSQASYDKLEMKLRKSRDDLDQQKRLAQCYQDDKQELLRCIETLKNEIDLRNLEGKKAKQAEMKQKAAHFSNNIANIS